MLELAWIAYWVILAILGVYGGHRLFLTMTSWRRKAHGDSLPATAPLPDDLPVVTVQLPLFNERYVAQRLIDAVAALDWPRDRLEIQILDDSTDDTRALCHERALALRAEGLDIVHIHRSDRTGFKAGALQGGLERARGELIAVFDADFVPPADFLRAAAPSFEDPGVGMAQARWEHLNREASLLTRVQALLLDGHFAIEQAARHATGRYFNFNGTAGIWRRQAIDDAGGWHHDTLTEDLDLSYRALLAGWRFVYLGQHAAPAELPMEMNAFKSQQYRWAKGSVQVARKLLPRVLRAQLPLRIKLEAFFHLTQNLPYLATLALILLAVPALVLRPSSAVETLALHLPALAFAALSLGAYCVTSQGALGRSRWRAVSRLPALVAVTAGICVNQARAVLEGALGHQSPFVRTPKHGLVGPTRRARYRGLRDLAPIAELALAAYFAGFVAVAIADGNWMVTPFLMLFASGFAYVGILSTLRR